MQETIYMFNTTGYDALTWLLSAAQKMACAGNMEADI